MNTISEIENAMADQIERPEYQAILKEFERCLKIMGNVDGLEIVAFVLAISASVKEG